MLRSYHGGWGGGVNVPWHSSHGLMLRCFCGGGGAVGGLIDTGGIGEKCASNRVTNEVFAWFCHAAHCSAWCHHPKKGFKHVELPSDPEKTGNKNMWRVKSCWKQISTSRIFTTIFKIVSWQFQNKNHQKSQLTLLWCQVWPGGGPIHTFSNSDNHNVKMVQHDPTCANMSGKPLQSFEYISLWDGRPNRWKLPSFLPE